ncbi:SVEP1-like protein, partial [Mya arenaria]
MPQQDNNETTVLLARGKNCGNVTNPINGSVTYVETTYDETANYSCDTGYNLSGNMSRTCQAHGDWSGEAPSCIIVDCGNVTNPINGSVTYVETTYDETANYSCDTGYNLSGNMSRTCQASGNWSEEAPSCIIVDCGNVTNPINGSVTYLKTTYDETANYSCDTGYNLSGNMSRTCQASGNWSEEAPSCIIVDCGNVTNPINGSVTHVETTYNETTHYSCDTGYNLHGNISRTCQAN